MTDNDIALIPKDDKYARELSEGVAGTVRFYGAQLFPELEQTRSLGLDGTEICWAGQKIHFALPGKHSLQDAMAAIAIAKEIPVSDSAIKKGLESVRPLFGRLEIIKGKRAALIRDCYNANPESTAKSVDFCDSVDWQGRKVYVILSWAAVPRLNMKNWDSFYQCPARKKSFCSAMKLKPLFPAWKNTVSLFSTQTILMS